MSSAFILIGCFYFFHVWCSLSDLKISASSCVFSVSLTNRCMFLCSDRQCIGFTETLSSLAYWCSYNLDTLQGLMSILTWLLLWPHFLLLRDIDGAVHMLMHLGNVLHTVCVCCLNVREKNKIRKQQRERVCLCVLMLHLNWPPALSQQ